MGNKVLVLRTCDKELKSHGDFQWPSIGPVSCPDWEPTKECGKGLYGLLWGIGDYGLTSSEDDAKWLVVEVDQESIVDLGEKVKFPSGEVKFSGDYATAATMVAREWIKFEESNAKPEDKDSGDSSNLAASGHCSNLAASGHCSNLAASGDSSKLAASGDSSKLAASGDYSVVAASNYNCQAKTGTNGAIALTWNDGNRPRISVGYVGEGLKVDTWYSLNSKGEFVEVK